MDKSNEFSLKPIDACRICGNENLLPVIDLGQQYLQGAFIEVDEPVPYMGTFPTSLVLCHGKNKQSHCGLLQTEYSVPPQLLYRKYWYRSGTNKTMRDHLAGLVRSSLELALAKDGSFLDIGCNDGTLLRNVPDEYERVGVDPSDIASDIKDFKVITDYFPSKEFTSWNGNRKFDFVTSIAMFYDLESPLAFARSLREILAPDGIWIFEMSYMPTMLRHNSYDTICHEHLEYYSLSVLIFLLESAGLMLLRVEENSINGGSIRCYVSDKDSSRKVAKNDQALIESMLDEERKTGLETEHPYKEFQKRIERHKYELHRLLSDLKGDGKRIHIYGASTKGNTILQWCDINNDLIEMAAERNPQKFGARTLGTDIPIVSEAESRSSNPDYYLVLPWHFRNEFLQREKEQIESGVGFIFPLPEIEIVAGSEESRGSESQAVLNCPN